MSSKLLLVLIASIATSSAFARDLECNQPGKKGYKIVASLGLPGMEATATLKIPGERGLREMSCAIPAVSMGRRGGDQTYPIAFCSEGKTPGYSIKLSGGGQIGKPKAIVKFTGKNADVSTEVATFYCDVN